MNAPGKFVDAPNLQLDSPRRIHAGDGLYAGFREFLEDEAALLDAGRLKDWIALFAADARYRMPVRISVNREHGDGFARRMFFYNDTRGALETRIRRLLDTSSGWVEDPPSRTTRMISGVRVFATDITDEFRVDSNILLARSRSDLGEVKFLTARRTDLLRLGDGEIRIARRDVWLNQTTIDMHNLAIFL